MSQLAIANLQQILFGLLHLYFYTTIKQANIFFLMDTPLSVPSLLRTTGLYHFIRSNSLNQLRSNSNDRVQLAINAAEHALADENSPICFRDPRRPKSISCIHASCRTIIGRHRRRYPTIAYPAEPRGDVDRWHLAAPTARYVHTAPGGSSPRPSSPPLSF
jgi:hypothetical protein